MKVYIARFDLDDRLPVMFFAVPVVVREKNEMYCRNDDAVVYLAAMDNADYRLPSQAISDMTAVFTNDGLRRRTEITIGDLLYIGNECDHVIGKVEKIS